MRGRPSPPLSNRAYSLSPYTALTFPRVLTYSVSGQHQHTPLSFSAFAQVSLAPFLPNTSGFKTVAASYPCVGIACTSRCRDLRMPLQPHVEEYGASVPLQGFPCVGHPAFPAEARCNVLQVTRSSRVSPRKKGMPEGLDRAVGPTDRPTFWSSVSVIFRWRPALDHQD